MNYVGEIKIFAGGYVPSGWLECDGSALPIPKYKDLFSVIGFDFTERNKSGSSGGAGRTTDVYFNLPKQRSLLPNTKFIICVEGYFSTEDRLAIIETTYSDLVDAGKITEPRDVKIKTFQDNLEYYEEGGKWDNFDTQNGGYKSIVYSIGPRFNYIVEGCYIDVQDNQLVEAFFNTKTGVYYVDINYTEYFDGRDEFYQELTPRYRKVVQIGNKGEVIQQTYCG
jgi:hypothetical protein